MNTYEKLDLVIGMLQCLNPKVELYRKVKELALELADKCLEEVNPPTTSRQPTYSS